MLEALRQAASATRPEVDAVSALELPEPSPAHSALSLEAVSDAFADQIRARMADLDMADAEALRGCGRAGDDGLGRIGHEMLLALDAGENTHIARELTALARALAATQSGAASAPDAASARLTLWQRLRRHPAPRAGRQAAEAWRQVGQLAEDLLRRHRDLMARLQRLDMLYEQGLDHYDALALDLATGQECLRLARLELAMPRRPDPATLAVPPPCCDVLERRLEEMAATRHRVAQALPLVRLAQEQDKRLLQHLSDLLSRALPDCARAAETTPPGPQEIARHDHCLTALLQGQALAEQGQAGQEMAREALHQMTQALADLSAGGHPPKP